MTEAEIRGYGYDKVKQIAKGGQGIIYKAVNSDGKTVAIKTLLPAATHFTHKYRHNREAQLMKNLTDGGVSFIPKYLGRLGENGPIVMEFIGGVDLSAYFNKPATTLNEFINRLIVFRSIVKMFSVLNRKFNTYHRDINGGNLRIFDGKAYILDFGTSAHSDIRKQEMVTQPLMVQGTMRFTAPEKLSGGNTTQRSEIYSLGVVLFHMMYGSSVGPYVGKKPVFIQEVIATITTGKLLKLSDANLSVNAKKAAKGIDSMIRKCLAFDERKRYGSFDDLSEALDSLTTYINTLISKPNKKWYQRVKKTNR